MDILIAILYVCCISLTGGHQMYVPGKLKNTDKVLVDIGTGFYVEKVCINLDMYVGLFVWPQSIYFVCLAFVCACL